MDADAIMSLLSRVYAPANSYVDDAGRHSHRVPSTIPAHALAALAANGLAPNTFRRFDHDDAVTGLRRLAAAVPERAAADAFVAGLGSASPRWRAVLPAWALGTTVPAHPGPTDGRRCDICFLTADTILDTTLAWWQRARSGAPLPGDVCGYLLALESATPPLPAPQPYDVWVLHEILDVIRSLPATTRASGAAQALRAAGLLPGADKWTYRSLLEDLAFVGVLQTPEHPGMLTAFTTARQRDQRPSVRVEVDAPLAFWRAADGVTEPLVQRLFGHLPRPAERPSAPATAAPARRARPGTRTAPLPAALRGEPRAGDLYAVRCREDAWVLAYCHRIDDRGGRRYGLVEYLDGVFTAQPTAADVDATVDRRLRGRGPDRWQMWASRLDATTGVRRIARDVAAPADDRPAPDRIGSGAAKDLAHLASWCFPDM
ncbi:hypothetical protein O7623_10520 [Solwaraspora sp. WMMD791]|uniref:hypothetical protein n=1 Tax=Solwaraspora sp. WMMD791 TaxID=3016086 RepID=UPI002499F9E3|nr:hypothetical protein [Solwaraspora sp. WMMD791]WFE29584.1 hypothetical protein O7623_10520 [Solwaraspora sp. WMMD791]